MRITDYERGVNQASDIFPESNTDDQYELRELIKDAPKFEHMERIELVAHAYGLFTAGNKARAKNAKLRDLVRDMWHDMPKSESCGWDSKHNHCTGYDSCNGECSYWYRMNRLGIEVD